MAEISEPSTPFLCSCRSLSGLHLLLFVCTVQRSCHRHSQRSDPPSPPGTFSPHWTPVLVRGGSCLVSPSLYLTLAYPMSSRNLYGRLPEWDQLLVSSLLCVWHRSVTKKVWVCTTRERKKKNGSCWIMGRDVTWWCWVERRCQLHWTFPW